MVTAVLLVQKATPETITQFHDQLSNELPTSKGKWNFNFKIFRNNPYSIPPDLVETTTTSPESKFLFTLSPSYLPDSTITLVNGKSAGVFTNLIEEEASELSHPTELTIPNEHLHRGATTGLNDRFDIFVGQKLQSLWTQRQIIKGDGGQIYELENGNLCIKTSNVFLHGNFRGLLIQIDLNDHLCDTKNPDSFKQVFDKVSEKYGIPPGNLCCEVLDTKYLDKYGDLCFQYSKILNF
ncbi:mediator of RNA polymerase II transcription subunit 20 [Spathaspora passalidarum NRRL Y-27907]|uniref:Mediator of RNA polymerase II transcription subunit 20 n=1 Tax=Spathaspora passalidarum (strain NRRL Y-27907 / 11-Y1) TaxID=619300 RepID=G3AFW5_SPAPN|nr:mediator of RNA polymerase II transcription subunit 20 [Spathaspora passalidarum NRRL Y-27907]EGW35103.1 mediator of RNA polymerase II transcription subunit 20 [Spathaspora passalidarum NRRL Y-27907]